MTIVLNVLLAGLVFFGGAVLNGGLFNQSYGKDLDFSTARIYDISTSLRKILLIPLGLTVYFLLPCWIAKLFNALKSNGVISRPREGVSTYEHFLGDLTKKMDQKAWSILGGITVVYFYYDRLKDFDPEKRRFYLVVPEKV